MITRSKIIRVLGIVISILLLLSVQINAQEDSIETSPFQVVSNHLLYLSDKNYDVERAAESFHPMFPMEKRKQIATELKHFYDGRGLEIELMALPRNQDYYDTLSGKFEYVLFPKKYPEIYLKKYGDIWYYSEETSLIVSALYREIFPEWADNIIEALPQKSKEKYLGVAIWQYLGLLSILFLIFILHFILSWLVDKILEKSVWEKIHIGKQHHKILYKLAKFVSLIILMALIKQLIPMLLLNIGFSSFLHKTTNILQIIFILLATFQIVSIIKIYLLRIAEKTETKMDDQLIPLLMKALKIIIGLVAVIHLLSMLGLNVTALIAGASIGGLAIALAAQDTFKNLFGSVMVFADKPFQIGDYITTTDIEGTVEHVGFRSTKIRKIDTSVISVPNGNIANATITNLGIRKFRILDTTINILYSTPPESIENFLSELRKIPPSQPKIQEDTWLIYLRHLSSSSIDIYFRVYIEATDFKTELSTRESIIFQIINAAKNTNVTFAYPSTSVYLESTEVTQSLAGKNKSISEET